MQIEIVYNFRCFRKIFLFEIENSQNKKKKIVVDISPVLSTYFPTANKFYAINQVVFLVRFPNIRSVALFLMFYAVFGPQCHVVTFVAVRCCNCCWFCYSCCLCCCSVIVVVAKCCTGYNRCNLIYSFRLSEWNNCFNFLWADRYEWF